VSDNQQIYCKTAPYQYINVETQKALKTITPFECILYYVYCTHIHKSHNNLHYRWTRSAFWWGCFAPPHLLRPGATATPLCPALSYATASYERRGGFVTRISRALLPDCCTSQVEVHPWLSLCVNPYGESGGRSCSSALTRQNNKVDTSSTARRLTTPLNTSRNGTLGSALSTRNRSPLCNAALIASTTFPVREPPNSRHDIFARSPPAWSSAASVLPCLQQGRQSVELAATRLWKVNRQLLLCCSVAVLHVSAKSRSLCRFSFCRVQSSDLVSVKGAHTTQDVLMRRGCKG